MSVEQKIVEVLAEENKALKAQIESIRCAFKNYDDDALVFKVLNQTPQQCLDDVRDDAITKLGRIMAGEFGIEVGGFVGLYVKQLRDKAK